MDIRLYEREEGECTTPFKIFVRDGGGNDLSIVPSEDRYLIDVGVSFRLKRFFHSVKGFHKVSSPSGVGLHSRLTIIIPGIP